MTASPARVCCQRRWKERTKGFIVLCVSLSGLLFGGAAFTFGISGQGRSLDAITYWVVLSLLIAMTITVVCVIPAIIDWYWPGSWVFGCCDCHGPLGIEERSEIVIP